MDAVKATIGHDDDHITITGLGSHRRDDGVHGWDVPCGYAGTAEVPNQLGFGQTLGLRERRAEHGRQNDLIGSR